MPVPVVDKNNRPLMPTSPARARRLIEAGRALRRWYRGVFAIKLVDREGGETQPVAVGIDPGSKREAFTVVAGKKTLLNVQTDAVAHVGLRVEQRRNARCSRRQRKTPCRPARANRGRGGLPPSTRSRWEWKLRIVNWLRRLYPVTHYVVEDVKAKTKKGKAGWNRSFSPLQAGKEWLYSRLRRLGHLTIVPGYATAAMRDAQGLAKSRDKLSDDWSAHCVDSFVLARSAFGAMPPDDKAILRVVPFSFHRRHLHMFQPAKGGARREHGGTRSLGLKRGSLVTHPKWGLSYVGGSSQGRLSLHSLSTGKRLCQNAKVGDVDFLAYNSWRWHSSHA